MKEKKDTYVNYIESLQTFIKDSDVPIEELDDFKEWNLIPGQQLYYKRPIGPSSVTHHAIYVGDGKIFEGGFNPDGVSNFLTSLLNPPIGLKTLKNWIERTKNGNADTIFIIKTKSDSNKAIILQRLERVKKLLNAKNSWHPLKTNCEAMANYISFGRQYSLQSQEWRKPFLLLFIFLIALSVLIWLYLS
uniref:Lecithin retinol acyltransferase n=1 Tax=Marseillevirus LCMAC101 TaxID=2506602 RepID=A0A481YSX4_9VIRU|nr:MAG: hypothetical protein LCMAC101_07740 [Marseillevirus LCMAC101]